MDSKVRRFLDDVVIELGEARSKFPESKHQLTALNEEVGELNQAMLQNHYDGLAAAEVYGEAVQVAAMALRVAVEGDTTFTYAPPLRIQLLSESEG